jgi:signal transduction histidine kinase
MTSMLPYAYGIYKGHIVANRISWSIWSFIGSVFFLSTIGNPKSDFISVLYAFVLMLNPIIITTLSVFKGRTLPIFIYEKVAFIVALMAMALWYFTQTSSLLPLVFAIIADISALIPTLLFVYKNPHEDRPTMWFLFFIGTALSIIGTSEYSIVTLLLPTYMLLGVSVVLYPLIHYRIKNRVSPREWV